MEYILRTTNLTKQYRNQVAVQGVNMHLERGDIYGLIGSNGSGKTTLLRMILGLVPPTSGEIELLDHVVGKDRRLPYERIGNMMQPALYEHLTVESNLAIHAKLMGIPSNRFCIEEVLSSVGLLEERDVMCKKLSLGMKQRLGIARAIFHRPELVVLDEPMNAVDPQGMKKIRELLVRLSRDHKTTILMSTHLLSDMEMIATKVGFIYRGELLREMDQMEIRNQNEAYIELKVDAVHKAARLLEIELQIMRYEISGDDIIRIYEQVGESTRVNRMLIENRIDVVECRVVKDTLEDYFLKCVGGERDV